MADDAEDEDNGIAYAEGFDRIERCLENIAYSPKACVARGAAKALVEWARERGVLDEVFAVIRAEES